jgi:hypothetical protein
VSAAKQYDEIWPDSNEHDEVLIEWCRRVNALPLDGEQVRAAMVNYRINASQYENRKPHLGKLYAALREAAYPKAGKTSPGSSEWEPTPFTGTVVTYAEWRRHAQANGIKDHLGRIMGESA